jgi:hypothetical protein
MIAERFRPKEKTFCFIKVQHKRQDSAAVPRCGLLEIFLLLGTGCSRGLDARGKWAGAHAFEFELGAAALLVVGRCCKVFLDGGLSVCGALESKPLFISFSYVFKA